MKKQFITGVLLLALTAGGVSTFTSCKDTDEDVYNELNAEQVSLRAALNKLQEQLTQCPTKCQEKIDSLKTELEKAIGEKADSATVDSLFRDLANKYADSATVAGLIAKVDSLQAKLDSLEFPEAPEAQFNDEQVTALKDLAAISTQITNFFAKDGGLDQMQSQLDGLSEWFEGIDKFGITSVEDFQKAVSAGAFVSDNKVAFEKLVEYLDEKGFDALDQLKLYYDKFDEFNTMYETIFENAKLPEGATDWWNYGEVMQNIMDNAAAIEVLKDDVDKLLNRLNDMVTSLVLQATTNSVFGSFNTPFGINSMVLMAPYGEIATNVREFPVSGVGAECYNDEEINWSDMTNDFYDLNERGTSKIVALNENKQAKLGNLWFTVNPGTVNNLDLNGFAIVNSVENDVVKLTNVTKDDETVLKFGIGSRAAGNGNGLYTAEAVIDPENLDQIKVHIESGLVESLKDAVKNRTASDMVQMLKAIYNQLQDICDANALRYTYTAATGKDANGNWIETEQKVYSNYGMAATAFKPLSYATLRGTSIGAHLPTFGSIEISKDLVDLNLGTFEVDGKNFELNLHFGQPEFSYTGVADQVIEIYDGDRLIDTVTIELNGDMEKVFNDITGSIEAWIGTGDDSLDARVEKAIWLALFYDPNATDNKYVPAPGESQSMGVVTDLVNQVNDMMGGIQDKLDDLVDKINSDYLGKVNSLISKYNTVAERINNALKDPNHYLQSVMLYRKAGKLGLNGHTPEVELPLGILSTDPERPTQFKGAGEAISLWATSYTFETVAPAFKKFVGVVSVKEGKADGTVVDRDDLAREANKTLAKVMNGDQTRVALNVKNAKGGVFTYEVAFQALDYTGHTSTVKCYLQVVR
ncbi:MAG: hypothetical protein K2M77_00230 [Muribaculaceae bacterium]|nr:hypothetical protein [Muribaculaceae bacterium]